MKLFTLTYLLLCLSFVIYAQGKDRWFAYQDEITELIGYKDENGIIQIEPRFTSFTKAKYFNKIIAVFEEINGSLQSYYLTKSGKIVCYNNLYISDNSPDCENEGFIRFKDSKSDLVGMLNGNGEIVVPAEYNDLSKVMNGFIIALRNAHKPYYSNDPAEEHFSWIDGEFILIETTNKIIIENFDYDPFIDFYSVKIEDRMEQDEIRNNYLSADGKYYSFINFEEEFKLWLQSEFLNNLTEENLKANSFPEIYYWDESEGWVNRKSSEFINDNFDELHKILISLTGDSSDYFISVDGLNPFIFSKPEFEGYFDNCNEPKTWQYPLLSIVINYWTGDDLFQTSFDFLRTENRYKLLSVSLDNESLK